jgi:hypothetical protein
MPTSASFASIALVLCFACGACTNEASTEPGDPPADAGTPSALGNGLRIADITTPDSSLAPAANQPGVRVTGATFVVQDHFNENGKPGSVGAIYVQDSAPGDAGAPPYSGIELYKSTFEPASLALAPGDVIDFIGEYQQFDGVASFMFNGAFQPEMYEPIITFRFDYSPPAPTVIQASDLEMYSTGYRWMSMLVTVRGSVGGGITESGGAGGVFLTSDTGPNAVTVDNELYPLPFTDPKYADQGHVNFKSVTGIVTYFDSFHIAPRSAADVETEPVE